MKSEVIAMRIKKGFVAQKIGDSTVVVSTGALSCEFRGMIELNQTAADIWSYFEAGLSQSDAAKKLSEEYGISLQKAEADVEKIAKKMLEAGVFEDE